MMLAFFQHTFDACGVKRFSNAALKIVFMFSFFSTTSNTLLAQVRPSNNAPTPVSKDSVRVLYSDLLEFFMNGAEQIRKLKGRVRLQHEDATLYCDSAVLDNKNNVLARGHVLIRQGDSLTIFADSVIYQGFTRVADLYGKEVVLVNGDKKIFTKKLNYNLATKVATYDTRSTLTNLNAQLTSNRGQYFTQTGEALFKGNVLVVDKKFELKSDTLRFNTKTNVATFLAPTLIKQDTANIYTEAGFYDITNDRAAFTRKPQYVKNKQVATADTMTWDGKTSILLMRGNAQTEDGKQQARANVLSYNRKTEETFLDGNGFFTDGESQNIQSDSIRYNPKTKTYTTRGRSHIVQKEQILDADFVDFDSKDSVGVARGNVFYQDTAQKVSIRCENLNYNQKTDYLKAVGGRPILSNIVTGDTLWLRADTIISQRDSLKDTVRTLYAYHKVRMYKSNFQSVCDSLVYSERDSIFKLFRSPVIWSDTTQMSADTIRMLLKDKKIDRAYLRQNAFIVNSKDLIFFNQIKGRYCTAFFEQDSLRRVRVEGNAESLYYATDDADAYIGVNKSVSSEMWIYMGQGKIESIKFLTQPQATMTPMRQANHEALKLKGYKWIIDRRPKSLKDL